MALAQVVKAINLSVAVLDRVARAALGSDCHGVSNIRGNKVVYVEDAGQNLAITNAILDNWNTLLVATDKTQVQADGLDTAIITHATPDASVDYYVWLDGVAYSFGEVTAIGGIVTLNLATDTPGFYTVILARQSGNYATGQTMIEAQGV